jgi:hypothetical protein
VDTIGVDGAMGYAALADLTGALHALGPAAVPSFVHGCRDVKVLQIYLIAALHALTASRETVAKVRAVADHLLVIAAWDLPPTAPPTPAETED